MHVEPVAALVGHVGVPGDKSISHRAVLIGALCEGETVVRGFGRSADTEATIAVVHALGAEVVEEDVDTVRVQGVGLRGLREPDPPSPLDCGNAGTLMRLLAGMVAGQTGRFELVGDESLSTRPMERVGEPLRRMGARVTTTDGHAPVVVEGARLRGIAYELPVASAQVKSAVLLAGLLAEEGETTVLEPVPTRDHTERMLERAGARVRRRPASVTVHPAERLSLGEVDVPGDFSSAAPFLVAAALLPGSEVTAHGVGLNPRRIGLLDVLERMGARIAIYNRRSSGGEPVGDVELKASELVGASISGAEVPALIDELPLFALAACHARGESVVSGAAELRAKESDRLGEVVDLLRGLGGHVRATDDGFRIRGVPTRLRGGTVHTRGDHRLAMLGAVAGLSSRDGVEIEDADAVRTSFPGFFDVLRRLAPDSLHYPPSR
jgi:3-phosphoshikimate 1-carboxyvinyltransferase